MSSVARRSYRTVGAGERRTNPPCRRLAQAALSNGLRFADGYAQAVTFGLLMARARKIGLSNGIDQVAKELRKSNSPIGTALRLLTDHAENQDALKTSLATLTRVLDSVDWSKISKGDPEAWLYFYEEFLGGYDNTLRKKTGSYYTPPEVVRSMVRLVDEALRSPDRFAWPSGLASGDVTIADPAVGTGTFLLAVFRQIADTIEVSQGAGAVSGAIAAAVNRLIGFELQFGPFAVAQLRLLAELVDLGGAAAQPALRLHITDTLGNPFVEQEWLPSIYESISKSRQAADTIKRQEPITIVIGNPPYKEKAKGRGGWIESGSPTMRAPLLDWMPSVGWGVGAHAKHLRNLHVYFGDGRHGRCLGRRSPRMMVLQKKRRGSSVSSPLRVFSTAMALKRCVMICVGLPTKSG